MDKVTYSFFYNKFAADQWKIEWKKKGAHTAKWPHSKLKVYTAKLRRLVLLKCYSWIEQQKESFFADIQNRN